MISCWEKKQNKTQNQNFANEQEQAAADGCCTDAALSKPVPVLAPQIITLTN